MNKKVLFKLIKAHGNELIFIFVLIFVAVVIITNRLLQDVIVFALILYILYLFYFNEGFGHGG